MVCQLTAEASKNSEMFEVKVLETSHPYHFLNEQLEIYKFKIDDGYLTSLDNEPCHEPVAFFSLETIDTIASETLT